MQKKIKPRRPYKEFISPSTFILREKSLKCTQCHASVIQYREFFFFFLLSPLRTTYLFFPHTQWVWWIPLLFLLRVSFCADTQKKKYRERASATIIIQEKSNNNNNWMQSVPKIAHIIHKCFSSARFGFCKGFHCLLEVKGLQEKNDELTQLSR